MEGFLFHPTPLGIDHGMITPLFQAIMPIVMKENVQFTPYANGWILPHTAEIPSHASGWATRGSRQREDAQTLLPRFSPEEFVAECFRKTSPDLDEEAYSDEGEDDSAQKET